MIYEKMFTLRKLIGIQSLKMFVFRDVANYYSSDFTREILTYQNYHNYPIEYFYMGCFLVTVILLNQYNHVKVEKIERVEKTWLIKLFVLVFTMIFTKNIENAI